jgi:hypothetical protein
LVFYFERNLIITQVEVEKTKKVATNYGVQTLIDMGKPEGIFFACLIKISVINTHPPIFILFWYKIRIGEPIWVVHFLNKTGV